MKHPEMKQSTIRIYNYLNKTDISYNCITDLTSRLIEISLNANSKLNIHGEYNMALFDIFDECYECRDYMIKDIIRAEFFPKSFNKIF